jgi:hypothetical protein
LLLKAAEATITIECIRINCHLLLIIKPKSMRKFRLLLLLSTLLITVMVSCSKDAPAKEQPVIEVVTDAEDGGGGSAEGSASLYRWVTGTMWERCRCQRYWTSNGVGMMEYVADSWCAGLVKPAVCFD